MKKHGRGRRVSAHKSANHSGTLKSNPWIKVPIAALVASAVSLGLIALYAFSLYKGWLSIYSVPVANTVIKAIGGLLAGFIAVIGIEKMRIVQGAAAGVLYIIFAFVMFSILSSSFNINTQLLMDIGMGAVSGALSGMVYGVLKKSKK